MIVIRGVPPSYYQRLSRDQHCTECRRNNATIIRLYADQDLHKFIGSMLKCTCGYETPWLDENGTVSTIVFIDESAKNVVDDSTESHLG